MSKKPQALPRCPVCGFQPRPSRPAGVSERWECSHVDCPNRHKVTAAPSDKPPEPKE